MAGSTGLCTTALPGDADAAPGGTAAALAEDGVVGPPPPLVASGATGSPPSTLTTLPRLLVRSISVPSFDEPRGLLALRPPPLPAPPPGAADTDDEPDDAADATDPELDEPPGP